MERSNYIDYAKALCIILVVFIHTGFSALNNIILFAMPLFFADALLYFDRDISCKSVWIWRCKGGILGTFKYCLWFGNLPI